jgi:hypothetical protein
MLGFRSLCRLLGCLAIIAIMASPAGARPRHDGKATTPASQGQQLRQDIEAEYRQLKASGAFASDTFGTDISSVVQHDIKVGLEFGRAEEILRQAGFTVGPRPGLTAEGGEDRYDVYATSGTVIPNAPRVQVRIGLRPDSPADYQEVVSVRAWILVLSPQAG